MAPRRGGNGGAGAEVATTGSGRNYFEPPPLKRMQPWQQDGSSQCDVIAGGVDETGVFKGIYVSGVHLMALMRTFQLSKVFMPCDVPTPVAALGQSLQDGVPIVIVTRGCFGRELDYGPGPCRNDTQKTIWQTARDMRAEMPQILITCIDIPINLSADMLQPCLEAPLNEYRELMYQDGTWYTPTVVNAAQLGKWVSDNGRDAKWMTQKGKTLNSRFNRKKFDWQDSARFYTNLWAISWRPVLEAQAPAQVPRRTDLRFTPDAEKPEVKQIQSAPSTAEAVFKKALAKAQDRGDTQGMMDAVTKYMTKANVAKETETLQEAMHACDEVAGKSSPEEAFEAVSAKFKIMVNMNLLDEAMEMAVAAKASAATAKIEAEALQLIVGCHQSLGDLDKAAEVAATGKAEVSRKGDEQATAAAYSTLVNAHLQKGDTEAAVAAAKEATTQKGQVEAAGYSLLAAAKMAESAAAQVPNEVKAAAAEAAGADSKAAGLFKALGRHREQADALKGSCSAHFAAETPAEALGPAVELQALGRGDFPAKATISKEQAKEQVSKEEAKAWEASGFALVVQAHLKNYAQTRSFLDGGDEAMVAAARAGLTVAEESGSDMAKGTAYRAIADALTATDPASDEGQKMAKKSAAAYKAAGGGESMYESLILAARTAVNRSCLTSAMWDAKQVLAEAAGGPSYDEALAIVTQVQRSADESNKPISVGGPVPIYSGGMVTVV